MAEYSKGRIIIIGHKNPGTDLIYSAICYANLKRAATREDSEPRRAGHVDEETQPVLKHFGVKAPELIEHVRAGVRDIGIREMEGMKKNISLKKTWNLMQTTNTVTLPTVTSDGMLEGLITMEDVAQSYMNVYNGSILSRVNTQYSSIIETLGGSLVINNADAYFNGGEVLIAAANPDMIEYYTAKNDLVVSGNRYESQLCAIEMDATCIIMCEGAPVSMTIKKPTQEWGCTIITAPHNVYTAAHLISQSMPISHFTTRDSLITFEETDMIDDIKEVMANKCHRDFPVLDEDGKYKGMISRRSLLGARGKSLILVDHNEKTQVVNGIGNARILEIIDHHRLGIVEIVSPIFLRNQPPGCTATVIYQMYQETGVKIEKEIAGFLCSVIISDMLLFRSPTCIEVDKQAGLALVEITGIGINKYAAKMFAAGGNLKSKSDEEIFYQGLKRLTPRKVSFGVGQISSLNQKELDRLKARMMPYLVKTHREHSMDMMFFMLTNILTGSTTLLCEGMGAESMILNISYVGVEEGGDKKDGIVELEDVVSRKKRLISAIGMALQD